ncbi:MAG: SprT-like domain-containing protein [Gammaproteobacteria bacterium]|nr:SprT-like domain-containing protein [Gammaproteobacteria bacterium]
MAESAFFKFSRDRFPADDRNNLRQGIGLRRPMLNTDLFERLFGNMDEALKQILSLEDAQVFFEIGDRVCFSVSDGGRMSGTVEKLNPKRAGVWCGADNREKRDNWLVPYAGLEHLCGSTAWERRPRADRLREVALEARGLMDRHGLAEWTLGFIAARGKLGECRPLERRIGLSRHHAVTGSPEQVADTVLHEIAHALAGSGAGHGPAWKAIARRIGATPRSGVHGCDGTAHDREESGHAGYMDIKHPIKEKFRQGDVVSFVVRGDRWAGTIERMNPRRAKVRCNEGVWLVPYEKLSADPFPDPDPGNRAQERTGFPIR